MNKITNALKSTASKIDKALNTRTAVYVGVGVGIAVAYIVNTKVKGPATVIIENTYTTTEV
jgi:hypothetical protein